MADTLIDPNLPPDVYAALQEAQRREKIAQALMQQGAQQPQGRMVGRFYVPPSPLQGAANMANTLVGVLGQSRADEARALAANQYRSGMTDALTQYMNTRNGTPADVLPEGVEGPIRPSIPGDPRKAVMEAMISQYPNVRQIGAMDYAADQKANQPFSLTPGQIRFRADGTPLAANDKPSPSDIPMTVKEWNYYKGLSREDQKAFLDMKRAPGFLDLGGSYIPRPTNFPVGGNAVPVPAIPGQPTALPAQPGQPVPNTGGAIPKTIPPEQTAEHKGDVAAAQQTGEAQAKRDFNMMGLSDIITEAKNILSGKTKPTSSVIGTGVDMLGSVVGMAPRGAPEADQLRAIGGALTAKMPRMEGPQSNLDVQQYKEMAGQVGDSTLPLARRLAALATIEKLWKKYDKAAPPAQPSVDDLLKKYGP